MVTQENILQAIYEAIDEMNANFPDLKLDRSTSTVLVGDASPLDSTGFLAFAVSVEQNLEASSGTTVHVLDLLEEIPEDRWTVEDMARAIAGSVDKVAHA